MLCYIRACRVLQLTNNHFSENGADGSLEEHLRKYLGEDYSKVFKEPDRQQEPEQKVIKREDPDPVRAFREDLDMSGYTGEYKMLAFLFARIW